MAFLNMTPQKQVAPQQIHVQQTKEIPDQRVYQDHELSEPPQSHFVLPSNPTIDTPSTPSSVLNENPTIEFFHTLPGVMCLGSKGQITWGFDLKDYYFLLPVQGAKTLTIRSSVDCQIALVLQELLKYLKSITG